MIDAEPNDFSVCQITLHKKYEDVGIDSSRSFSRSSIFVRGLDDYLSYISRITNKTTQFIVVYDVSCPNKEKHIKKLLTEINAIKQNDSLPTIISIGNEQRPLAKKITKQVLVKKVSDIGNRKKLFFNIIETECRDIEEKLLSTDIALKLQKNINLDAAKLNSEVKPSLKNATPIPSKMDINMMVLGGFIAVAGIAAVAIAFTVINTASFGAAGLAVAIVGVAATLAGVGLFATEFYTNRQTTTNESLNFSGNFVHQ